MPEDRDIRGQLQKERRQLTIELLRAIRAKNLAEVRRLVARGADVTEEIAGGLAIHHAAKSGAAEILDYLLQQHGSLADARTNEGDSVGHILARKAEDRNPEHVAAVRAYLRANPNLSLKNKREGALPHEIARRRGQKVISGLLRPPRGSKRRHR